MRSVSSVAPGQHLAAALGKALIALASVAILAVAGISPAAAGDRPPGGVLTNPVVRAIDLASPAVVRIATLYSAHVTLSACGITATLPTSGAYTVGGLGSGAFVSAKGDILTADHVVDIDRQSLDASIFEGQQSSADVATFLNTACHPSVPVTPNDVASGIVQFNGFPFSIGYSSRRVLVWRSTSYLGAISAGQAGGAVDLLSSLLKAPYNVASVVKTSLFTDDDIALIHVGLTDTPNIQLDSSSQLAVEDSLAVIGFPGNGDVNGDPTNLLTPSVNNVSVSALKRNDNGSQLIQVGGNVEHGDSGGPVLDTAGHIVGIVSFGGSDVQGITAFLRSSDSALTLLNVAQVSIRPQALSRSSGSRRLPTMSIRRRATGIPRRARWTTSARAIPTFMGPMCIAHMRIPQLFTSQRRPRSSTSHHCRFRCRSWRASSGASCCCCCCSSSSPACADVRDGARNSRLRRFHCPPGRPLGCRRDIMGQPRHHIGR